MANLRANRITSTEVFETTGSVQFDGSGDYLETDKAPFQMLHKLTSSWTIESWIYLQNPNDQLTVFDTGGSSNTVIGISLYIDSQIKFRLRQALSTLSASINIDHNLNYYSWHHLSVTFDYDTKLIRIFVDGKLVGSTTYGTESSIDSSKDFKIGAYEYSTNSIDGYLKGHISNLRILKGTALYTENFTPPTRELEVIPNTVLLACQSTTKADEEKTGKTITVNGNAVANELTPGLLTSVVKSGGSSAITGSVEFDGTGDYLTFSGTSTDFAFGTGDFTIEGWFYRNVSATYQLLIDFRLDSSSDVAPMLYLVNGVPYLYTVGGNRINGGQSVSNNSWFHLALCRSGTNTRLFLNGNQIGSTYSDSNNYVNKTNRPIIGSEGVVVGNNPFNGFISNLRVIKGTALYTSNFIPPTRKLTKLPGTALLCCQDSNDPTTEATGKTITGYGDLEQDPPELVTDGGFDSAANWPSAGADWTISGGVATISSADSGFDFLGNLTSSPTNGLLYELTFDISNWTAGRLELAQSDSSNIGVTVTGNGSYTFRFRYTGTTNGNISLYAYTGSTSSFTLDNVSLKRVSQKRKGSDFTPSVGSDGSVEFAGPTTINTENYFYLPTGPTEQRGRGRGLFGGGDPGINTINYITIASMGNAQDFGDLSQTRLGPGSVASSTRAVFMTGYSGANVDTMDFVTIATTGNAVDFGNLADDDRHETAGVSNQTRGMVGGGQGSAISDRIDYITIASTGDSIDFGNLTLARRNATGVMSPTRGVFCGGRDNTPAPSTQQEEMDYVTISSTGNALDFGDLTVARGRMGSVCSSVRGVVGGGEGSPADSNVIDYITIASTGNAQDFGDMITASEGASGGCSNSMRGVFGGHDVPGGVNTMEYVTISSTGNSQDFGDLLNTAQRRSGCSDSHGGLG